MTSEYDSASPFSGIPNQQFGLLSDEAIIYNNDERVVG
jgi:hypothetical protein